MADSFVKDESGREWVDCAYEGCRNRAILRKKNANLCLVHYDQRNLEAALKWNHDNGLETIEQRQKFIFKNKGKVFGKIT